MGLARSCGRRRLWRPRPTGQCGRQSSRLLLVVERGGHVIACTHSTNEARIVERRASSETRACARARAHALSLGSTDSTDSTRRRLHLALERFAPRCHVALKRSDRLREGEGGRYCFQEGAVTRPRETAHGRTRSRSYRVVVENERGVAAKRKRGKGGGKRKHDSSEDVRTDE